MKGYRKLLIAVNGSNDVLKYGIKLAKDEGCWVTILKIIPPYDGDLHLTGIKNVADIINSNIKIFFNEVKDIAESERALVKIKVQEGDIEEKILEAAVEENVDLIILQAEKPNPIKKLFGKDLITKIINQAPCPVLVVR
ncbi:universal stress protein [Thermodesulfovibrio sp.]|jgi:nucleotide-binding universal stress UspA family protein|uniref:universal stress protein n=1 Tax=Thermodesulfovibrio sp. TaxID=2067987 RepID=UPI003C7C07A2